MLSLKIPPIDYSIELQQLPGSQNVVFLNRNVVYDNDDENTIPHVRTYVQENAFLGYARKLNARKCISIENAGENINNYAIEFLHIAPSFVQEISEIFSKEFGANFKTATEFLLLCKHLNNLVHINEVQEQIIKNQKSITDQELKCITDSISYNLVERYEKEFVGSMKSCISIVINLGKIEKNSYEQAKQCLTGVYELSRENNCSDNALKWISRIISLLPLLYKACTDCCRNKKRLLTMDYLLRASDRDNRAPKMICGIIMDMTRIDPEAALYVLCKRYMRERFLAEVAKNDDKNNPTINNTPAANVLKVLLRLEDEKATETQSNDSDTNSFDEKTSCEVVNTIPAETQPNDPNTDSLLDQLYNAQNEDAFCKVVDTIAEKTYLSY